MSAHARPAASLMLSGSLEHVLGVILACALVAWLLACAAVEGAGSLARRVRRQPRAVVVPAAYERTAEPGPAEATVTDGFGAFRIGRHVDHPRAGMWTP